MTDLWKERFIYFAIFAGSVFSLVFAYLTKDAESFSGRLAHFVFLELAIAGLISLIVIATIERFTRERIKTETANAVRNIRDDVFEAVVTKMVPEFLGREVINLLRGPFVRHNSNINYIATVLEDAPGYIMVTVRTSYTAESLIAETYPYRYRMAFERPIDPGLEKYCKFTEVRIQGPGLEPIHLTATEDIAKYVKEEGPYVVFEREIKFPGRSKVDFQGNFQAVRFPCEREVWRTRDPSSRHDVRVTSAKGIRVMATSLHPQALKEGVDHRPTLGAYHWYLDRGIFPHQGFIELRWESEELTGALLKSVEKN